MQNVKLRNGITLLELLIAVSILTLVLFAGSGIYLSAWNMFRDAQFMSQAQRNAVVPMLHMTKNLQGAIRFTTQSATELRFTEYTNIITQASTTRRYLFSAGDSTIRYDADTTAGGEIQIGTRISAFSYTINANSILATINITATDNNGQNAYSISTITEARNGATPPV